MRWWLAVGPREHWLTAFKHGNVWGVRDIPALRRAWEMLGEGDGLLFYVTTPVKGVIGYGRVRAKFEQEQPLWPREVEEGRAIWPLRFEFDVEYCLPVEEWESGRVTHERLAPRRGFGPVDEEVAGEIVQRLRGRS